jgi:hypothetical protein
LCVFKSSNILSFILGQLDISKVWIKEVDIFYFNKVQNSCEVIKIFENLIDLIVGWIDISLVCNYCK